MEFWFSNDESQVTIKQWDDEITKILSIELIKKWEYIKEKSIKDFSNITKLMKKKNIIHSDFDFWNIIAPDIIICTKVYGCVEKIL